MIFCEFKHGDYIDVLEITEVDDIGYTRRDLHQKGYFDQPDTCSMSKT